MASWADGEWRKAYLKGREVKPRDPSRGLTCQRHERARGRPDVVPEEEPPKRGEEEGENDPEPVFRWSPSVALVGLREGDGRTRQCFPLLKQWLLVSALAWHPPRVACRRPALLPPEESSTRFSRPPNPPEEASRAPPGRPGTRPLPQWRHILLLSAHEGHVPIPPEIQRSKELKTSGCFLIDG